MDKKRALLVVDEAQNLTPRAIEELRMLSNFQLGDQALLQSFLVGQPELRAMMQSPQMQQLRQRVIASYHLGPLDTAETQAYIEHRLKHVGWKDDPAVRARVLRPDPRADRRHSAADQHAVQPAAARGVPRGEARASTPATCRRSRARSARKWDAESALAPVATVSDGGGTDGEASHADADRSMRSGTGISTRSRSASIGWRRTVGAAVDLLHRAAASGQGGDQAGHARKGR